MCNNLRFFFILIAFSFCSIISESKNIRSISELKALKSNSICTIKTIIDLQGEALYFPLGCKLRFKGGKLVNGTLIGNNTEIVSNNKTVFQNVDFDGVWRSRFSPFWFGLKDSSNGVERYDVLYCTHKAAVQANTSVSYSDIDEIHLSISKHHEPLPLSMHNDFSNVSFCISNNSKRTFLFSEIGKAQSVSISKYQLMSKDISDISPFQKGEWILLATDENPWIDKRLGYSTNVVRTDVCLVKNGVIVNDFVSSYDTPTTRLICSYYKASESYRELKNLNIKRESNSTYMTLICQLVNQDKVSFEHISVFTPSNSDMNGDTAFKFSNCANIEMKDVIIDGTYSTSRSYGYGIYMTNVISCRFENLVADGNWGVFGTYCINDICLNSCNINRFDVHCYGRNIYCKNTKFHTLYNQFSSMFGFVRFEDCIFENCTPVLIEGSYNAYTDFDIYFKDCIWNVTYSKNYLISGANPFGNLKNARTELSEKKMPRLYFDNLIVNIPENVKMVGVYKLDSLLKRNINVDKNGIKINKPKNNILEIKDVL